MTLILSAALLLGVTLLFLGGAGGALSSWMGPPNQPVGAYELVEAQEGDEFFDHYDFYKGPDSEGSDGYVYYVDRGRAEEIGIARVEMEV